MLLSNIEIHKALDEGRLVIDPEPQPRFKEIGVKYCPYDSHTVDLRLGNEIKIPKLEAATIDFTAPGKIANLIARNSDQYILEKNQPYTLQPRKFLLAQTLEKITLPIIEGLTPLWQPELKERAAELGAACWFTSLRRQSIQAGQVHLRSKLSI